MVFSITNPKDSLVRSISSWTSQNVIDQVPETKYICCKEFILWQKEQTSDVKDLKLKKYEELVSQNRNEMTKDSLLRMGDLYEEFLSCLSTYPELKSRCYSRLLLTDQDQDHVCLLVNNLARTSLSLSNLWYVLSHISSYLSAADKIKNIHPLKCIELMCSSKESVKDLKSILAFTGVCSDITKKLFVSSYFLTFQEHIKGKTFDLFIEPFFEALHLSRTIFDKRAFLEEKEVEEFLSEIVAEREHQWNL